MDHITKPPGEKDLESHDARRPLDYVFAVVLLLILIATGFSAYFSARQWLTAADQERRSLRAYVFIDTASFGNTDTMIFGIFSLKNSGRTPAYEFANQARAKLVSVDRYFGGDEKVGKAAMRGVIAPGGSINPLAGLTIEGSVAETVAAIRKGEIVFAVWGAAEYRDAFDSFWCLEYRMHTVVQGDGTIALTAIDEGNGEYSGRCAE